MNPDIVDALHKQAAENGFPVTGLQGQSVLVDDLQLAWKHVVRAYNCCENAGWSDTQEAMADIVVSLSQQLEYAMSNP